MTARRVTNEELAELIEKTDKKVDKLQEIQNSIDTQLRGDGELPGHHERIRALEQWQKEQKSARKIAIGALITSIAAVVVFFINGYIAVTLGWTSQ